MGHWAKTLLALSQNSNIHSRGMHHFWYVLCPEIKDIWSLCQHLRNSLQVLCGITHGFFFPWNPVILVKTLTSPCLVQSRFSFTHLRKASHAGGEYYSNEAYLLCFSFCKNHSPVFPVVHDLQASASDMLPSIIIVCFLKTKSSISVLSEGRRLMYIFLSKMFNIYGLHTITFCFLFHKTILTLSEFPYK